MKLSEAIRLNGMVKPLGAGSGSMASLDAPCALGGALQVIGKFPQDMHEGVTTIEEIWPFTTHPSVCPCGKNHGWLRINWIERLLFPIETRQSIASIIIVLSDYHRWTRNQIADWVATVEPAEPIGTEEMSQLEHVTSKD